MQFAKLQTVSGKMLEMLLAQRFASGISVLYKYV